MGLDKVRRFLSAIRALMGDMSFTLTLHFVTRVGLVSHLVEFAGP